MIFTFIMSFIASFIGMIFDIIHFPIVTLAGIPFIGDTIIYYLTLVIGYWNTFLLVIPLFAIPWNLFLNIIVPFEIALIMLKFFLGHRSPVAHH